MTAISNINLKSSKGIRIIKGEKVTLFYRENKYCDVIKNNGQKFTTTTGVANKRFNWVI